MKITAIVDKSALVHDSQNYWRVDLPFSYMNRYGIQATTLALNEHVALPKNIDVLLLPKLCVEDKDREEIEEFFHTVRSQGTTIVYDADDDVWSTSFVQYMTQLHLQLQPDKANDPTIVNAIIQELQKRTENSLWALMQCDAVTVSTKELQELVKTLVPNKPVFLIENAIDVEGIEQRTDKERQITHPHYTTVGWAGGVRTQDDLRMMLSAWNKIAHLREDVKFVIAGWTPQLQEYESLTEDNLIHIPWTSVQDYTNGMQVDIGCVCVGDSLFSSRKSLIKAWEFSVAGAMVMGSKNLYGLDPIPAANDEEDWVKILAWYINNFEEREKMAEAYNKFVRRQYDIKYNWVYWPATYESILNVCRPLQVR